MADFSSDKHALQNTLALLDTDVKVEDVVGYSPSHEPYQSTDLLFLQTVLEVCCSVIEPDVTKRKRLFTVLEKMLIREKIMSPNVRLEGFTDFRRKSAEKFMFSLLQLHSSLIPSPKNSNLFTKFLNDDPNKKYSNTYQDNFEELSIIAEGGFGVVCKARHKVDGLVYAVKKIIFNFEREKDYTTVMNEVKSISTLSHKNIVSYKNCWIQDPFSMEEVGADDCSSRSVDSKNFSGYNQRRKKTNSASILNYTSNGNSLYSSPNLKFSKNCKENLLKKSFNITGHSNKRVSISVDVNKSEDHQSLSESKNDQSIICDAILGSIDQTVLTRPKSLDLGINKSNLSISTASEGSWMTSPERTSDDERYRNIWNNFAAKNGCNSSSSRSNSSTDSDSALNQTSDLGPDASISRNDSTHNNLVSASDDLNDDTLYESDDETLNYEHDDTSSEQESVQSLVFSRDPASLRSSILENGDFNTSVTISLCKTSNRTTWTLSSTPKQTCPRSTDNSVVCYDSKSAATSPDFDLKFKPKNRAMLCIQMEYCYCDLKLWLEQRAMGNSLPFQKEIKDIFKEIVGGVSYIHSKSIIHRDLKPANIFYSKKDNSMKIGDFGLATLSHSSPNRQRVVNSSRPFTSALGTRPYAAPEQMRKHNYDNKVDIYSLGIILIELLLPFSAHELSYALPRIIQGDMPKELTSQWPAYVDLVKNLIQNESSLRMTAKEILELSVMDDDAEVDRRLLISEIKDLKTALEERDKKFEDALNEKNAIIEKLHLEIKELSNVIKNLKSKKRRKKH